MSIHMSMHIFMLTSTMCFEPMRCVLARAYLFFLLLSFAAITFYMCVVAWGDHLAYPQSGTGRATSEATPHYLPIF